MKTPKHSKPVAVVFLCLIFICFSCSKDDDDQLIQIEPSKGVLILYVVNGNSITLKSTYEASGEALKYQEDTAKHNAIWKVFDKIAVDDHRKYVKEFELFYDPDGRRLATVSTRDNLSFRLGVSITAIYENDKLKTDQLAISLIHEYGHLISNNKTQSTLYEKSSDCKKLFLDNDCYLENGYMDRFYNKFWKDIASDWNNGKNTKFYDQHQKQFVTFYASVSPGEDFAETFAEYVTKNLPEQNESIPDQKILFLDQMPTLKTLREKIRKSIGL